MSCFFKCSILSNTQTYNDRYLLMVSIQECDLACCDVACIYSMWMAAGDMPDYLPHTLVRLTLCNGCYLITENGRGEKSCQPMLREKTFSVTAAGRLLSSYWLRKLLSQQCDRPSQRESPRQLVIKLQLHFIRGKGNRMELA